MFKINCPFGFVLLLCFITLLLLAYCWQWHTNLLPYFMKLPEVEYYNCMNDSCGHCSHDCKSEDALSSQISWHHA